MGNPGERVVCGQPANQGAQPHPLGRAPGTRGPEKWKMVVMGPTPPARRLLAHHTFHVPGQSRLANPPTHEVIAPRPRQPLTFPLWALCCFFFGFWASSENFFAPPVSPPARRPDAELTAASGR